MFGTTTDIYLNQIPINKCSFNLIIIIEKKSDVRTH